MKMTDLVNEEKWSGDVKTKKHPPEGLFANGSAAQIVAWLKREHPSKAGSMSALNFYINRAGSNLSPARKDTLAIVKREISSLKEEALTEAESPTQLRSGLVKAFKELGYKLHSQESSPGALKAWLEAPSGDKKELRDIGVAVAKKLPGKGWKFRKKEGYSPASLFGRGFEIEEQDKGSLFIAVYRKGQAGMEYEMGVDS